MTPGAGCRGRVPGRRSRGAGGGGRRGGRVGRTSRARLGGCIEAAGRGGGCWMEKGETEISGERLFRGERDTSKAKETRADSRMPVMPAAYSTISRHGMAPALTSTHSSAFDGCPSAAPRTTVHGAHHLAQHRHEAQGQASEHHGIGCRASITTGGLLRVHQIKAVALLGA